MRPTFRLLGPVAVLEEGTEVPIGAPRLRTLLAALLVNANQTVTFSELVLWLWDGEPPAHPQRALHTAVSRLHAVLGPEAGLQTVIGGYRLEVADEQLDLRQFRLLAAAGTIDNLTAALRLWVSEPLTGALDYPVVRDQRSVLQEEWLRVTEQLMDARLALREHTELVPELTALTKQYPLRERFWAQLILALHNSARQADALTAYHQVADLLRDELGIDPGEEIRRVHLAVLAGGVNERPSVPAEWQVHRQLPLDIGDFVGRQDEADSIVDRLTSAAGVPVVTISGPPGAGKTALALRIAAGHLALRSDDSIAAYAEELRGSNRLLALAVVGEPDAAVEGAFARSYEGLVPNSRRLFATSARSGRDRPYRCRAARHRYAAGQCSAGQLGQRQPAGPPRRALSHARPHPPVRRAAR